MNPQKDLLGHLLSLAPIPEHPEGNAEDPVLIGPHEPLEGLRFPPPERLDERRILGGSLVRLDNPGDGKFPLHSAIIGETERRRNFSCIIRLIRKGGEAPLRLR